MIENVVKELNLRSKKYKIGDFPQLRKSLKRKQRIASSDIFTPESTNIEKEYAFHYGGRTELQFNVGFEPNHGKDIFRYGVAYSLEPSRSLTDVSVLYPSISKFNEFICANPSLYSDLRFWVWPSSEQRTVDTHPGPIDQSFIRRDNFIFLGGQTSHDHIDYDLILETLDRLLPLYEYVESPDPGRPFYFSEISEFAFKSGCSVKSDWTQASHVQKIVDVELRHNEIQKRLYAELLLEYGELLVGTEIANGIAGRIDVVAKNGEEFHFFEIKTLNSARACIRAAIGQLLEYALWPGCQIATKIVVVGEPPLDRETKDYLSVLNANFPVPISYRPIRL